MEVRCYSIKETTLSKKSELVSWSVIQAGGRSLAAQSRGLPGQREPEEKDQRNPVCFVSSMAEQ